MLKESENMADLLIKMGVNAPSDDINDIMKILDYAYAQKDSTKRIVMQMYATDLSDGAVGVISSMTISLKYADDNGEEKHITEHIIDSFKRFINDENRLVYEIIISELSHQLIYLVFEQRKYECNEEDRSRYIQERAKELGII